MELYDMLPISKASNYHQSHALDHIRKEGSREGKRHTENHARKWTAGRQAGRKVN